MKIESRTKTPDNKPALIFRTNSWELEIIKGLIKTALMHTPLTPQTKETIQRLRSINRGFDHKLVNEFLKENKNYDLD